MDWQKLRICFAEARRQGLRAKEAAQACGIAEGVAVEAHTVARGALHEKESLRVHPIYAASWVDVLRALEACGPLMALTRNESVVHEKTGVYQNVSAQGGVGLALGESIDLRLFFTHWHAGYAVTEPNQSEPGSLQFFDAYGRAVHKIFRRPQTRIDVWQAVIQRFIESQRTSEYLPLPIPAAQETAGPVGADVAQFLEAWASMTDTHEFFPLLKRFSLDRLQALKLAQGRFAHRVPRQSVSEVLHEAAFDQTPIMVFVGSPGCIQIHTGPVRRVETLEVHGRQWLNVLDEDFNLHLLEDRVEECWVVEKPTSDGPMTSLEVFDGQGELMAMLFGARKPGQPELAAWRQMIMRLPGVGMTACV